MNYPSKDEGAGTAVCYIKNDRVILDFRKNITWIAFDKTALRGFIDGLESKYKQL